MKILLLSIMVASMIYDDVYAADSPEIEIKVQRCIHTIETKMFKDFKQDQIPTLNEGLDYAKFILSNLVISDYKVDELITKYILYVKGEIRISVETKNSTSSCDIFKSYLIYHETERRSEEYANEVYNVCLQAMILYQLKNSTEEEDPDIIDAVNKMYFEYSIIKLEKELRNERVIDVYMEYASHVMNYIDLVAKSIYLKSVNEPYKCTPREFCIIYENNLY